MFYFITNSLIRDATNGKVRKKVESQSNFSIFNHHSTIYNFNFSTIEPETDKIQYNYLQFINSRKYRYISTEIREHILLSTRGKLIFNQQRRHWRGIDCRCRLCLKNNVENASPENLHHILSVCPITQPLITRFFLPRRIDLGGNNDFLYIGSPKCDLSEFLNVDILLFTAYIINCLKTTGKPSFAGLINMTDGGMQISTMAPYVTLRLRRRTAP